MGITKALAKMAYNRTRDVVQRSSNAVSNLYRARQTYGMGGLTNPSSGMGGAGDKIAGTFATPSYFYHKGYLEALYIESWAMRKYIDLPIDDMCLKWRQFGGNEDFHQVERQYELRNTLQKAMKAADLYGTSLIVLMLADAPTYVPLDINMIRQGDLTNLLVVDRYDLSPVGKYKNPYNPKVGRPEMYRVTPKDIDPFVVHESRCVRFDGIAPLGVSSWYGYDSDWGVGKSVPAISTIIQDASLASAGGHLAQEASIPVVKVEGYKDVLAGNEDFSIELLGERINQLKSIYHTMFVDRQDDFERVAVTWTGLPDLMDRYARRLAAMADIPSTRFWNQSPIGLNATGESDMMLYAMMLASRQKKILTEPLSVLDRVLSRTSGVPVPKDYTWPPLLMLNDKAQSEVAKNIGAALKALVEQGILSTTEAKSFMADSKAFELSFSN